jgi:hypothetical protein
MRQIIAFSLGLARELAGEEEDGEETPEDILDAFGGDLKHLAAMSEGSLLTFFALDERQDAQRALGVASLMARESARSRSNGDRLEAERLRRRAELLVDALARRSSSSERPEVHGLLAALRRPPSVH